MMKVFNSFRASFFVVLLLYGWKFVPAFAQSDDHNPDTEDEEIHEFYEELKKTIDTGEDGPILKSYIKKDQQRLVIWDSAKQRASDMISCELCDLTLRLLLHCYNGRNDTYLYQSIILLCTKLGKQRHDVCKGIIDLQMPTATYITKNRPNLSPSYACSILLQPKSCFQTQAPRWTVNVKEKSRKRKKVRSTPSSQTPLNIIHITDVHVDPLYCPGCDAECDYPICGRSGSPKSNSQPAGTWGDYRKSDIPWSVVKSALDQIKSQHSQIDYLYFTGDIVPHNVWNTTQEEVIELSNTFMGMLKERFQNVPIFPILGNHDVHPVNLFSPTEVTDSEVSTQWIYDFMAELWSPFLPSDTKSTIKKGGYYTVLVKPGFRIIALNSNLCYTLNLWLLYDSVDPGGQLQWFADTMDKAEQNNEFVHVLSHVPPGDTECLITWGREFRRIINRYSHLIKGQFNGHTHYEETRLFFHRKSGYEVNNIAYNGGGLSTFTDLNPNYRLYTADAENYDLIDYTSWIYNVTEANENPSQSPKWYPLYSFQEKYGVKSLRPTHMQEFIDKLSKQETELRQYIDLKLKSSTNQSDCDSSCLSEELCYIVTAEYGDNDHCYHYTHLNSWWKK